MTTAEHTNQPMHGPHANDATLLAPAIAPLPNVPAPAALPGETTDPLGEDFAKAFDEMMKETFPEQKSPRTIPFDPNDGTDDIDIDFPPINDPNKGPLNVCEWEFDNCYEKGTWVFCPHYSTATGRAEEYRFCQRHFLIMLERATDIIGSALTRVNRDLTAHQLCELVLSNVMGWRHPAAASEDAVEFPSRELNNYLNAHIGPNEYREEHADGTDAFPNVERRVGITPAVLEAINDKIDTYLTQHPEVDDAHVPAVSAACMQAFGTIAGQHSEEAEALDAIRATPVERFLVPDDRFDDRTAGEE